MARFDYAYDPNAAGGGTVGGGLFGPRRLSRRVRIRGKIEADRRSRDVSADVSASTTTRGRRRRHELGSTRG